ncbi:MULTISPECIES: branched-chain amino acid ABC transporter substrate-binding protein [Methylobacterium]|uniref:Leu/Ile/Val-binding protein n=1 Tax=Methylobacterium hispanicum TaxID=270350 RepID=A0AAV4ZSY6_9HYPH|nr:MULTISPECIES: branched-chain amino acid ABC transporter substrate-binding protein [Methylobacterium]MBE7197586.1 branched-chain amino acid ABC transporter substrate-binding protein [Parafilimonas terrae]GJD91075.1 Leu/Ile/Val-binding protein [Methylobacterium hispanicum]
MRATLLAGLALGLLSAGSAQAQLKIAVGAPITGNSAAFGAQLKNGTAQAVEDINKAGGIKGQKLELAVGDDASDPKQGVSVANKFASDGVKFVVGHFNSGVSIPASDVYADAGIVEVTPASTNVKFTERGLWNTFRTCGRDDQQGAVAGEYLTRHFKGKKVAIIHDKTPYGKGLADETLKAFKAKGGKEALYEGINPGEKDYSALVSKLKQNGIDVVYFGGYYTEAGLIIRQMRDQGLKAPLMGGDGMVDKELVAIAGPGAEGTLTTFPPDARKNPNAKDVVAGFKAKGIDPEAYTLYAYAAVQIYKQAVEGAGSPDAKKVAAFMREGKPFQTVLGPISFDKKGDITKPDYVMYTWKKNDKGVVDYAGNEVTQ